MDKNLKDYLHFYLGCYVVSVYPTNPQSAEKLTGSFYDKIIACDREVFTYHIKYIKPILYKLSDMTDEDYDNWAAILPEHSNERESFNEIVQDAKRTKYLLSKHYDLYGLIESGLAIDAKTNQ